MEKKFPLVSILIPCYNREKFIVDTIKSAINQTYENIEVVVVDNCSEDTTWEKVELLAKQDSRVKVWQNPENIGPVKNWKRCIDEASGEYAKILWSDDLMDRQAIEKLLCPFLDKGKEIAFSLSSVAFVNEAGVKTGDTAYELSKGNKFFNSADYLKSLMLADSKYPVSPGCALFRLADLKANLLLTIPSAQHHDFANIAIGNDLYIFLKIASLYGEVAYVNGFLNVFREHANSISVKSSQGKLVYFYQLFRCYFYQYNVGLFDNAFRKEFLLRLWYFSFKYNLKKFGVSSLDDFFVSTKIKDSLSFYDKMRYFIKKGILKFFG